MNIFSSLIRDIRESKEGRIRRYGGHWELAPGEDREDGSYAIPDVPKDAPYLERFVRISTDKQGRKMRLVDKRAVHCPNPQYIDQFASLRDGAVCLSVPEPFCRKCPHYRTARQSRRKYATCGYKAAENPAAATLAEFTDLMTKAATKANELMG
uniref:Uncharacterized protein n=1 Tax=viral metagenome TaxID=1070528 RepID=A0A6M3JQP8_9ZZZZ